MSASYPSSLDVHQYGPAAPTGNVETNRGFPNRSCFLLLMCEMCGFLHLWSLFSLFQSSSALLFQAWLSDGR